MGRYRWRLPASAPEASQNTRPSSEVKFRFPDDIDACFRGGAPPQAQKRPPLFPDDVDALFRDALPAPIQAAVEPREPAEPAEAAAQLAEAEPASEAPSTPAPATPTRSRPALWLEGGTPSPRQSRGRRVKPRRDAKEASSGSLGRAGSSEICGKEGIQKVPELAETAKIAHFVAQFAVDLKHLLTASNQVSAPPQASLPVASALAGITEQGGGSAENPAVASQSCGKLFSDMAAADAQMVGKVLLDEDVFGNDAATESVRTMLVSALPHAEGGHPYQQEVLKQCQRILSDSKTLADKESDRLGEEAAAAAGRISEAEQTLVNASIATQQAKEAVTSATAVLEEQEKAVEAAKVDEVSSRRSEAKKIQTRDESAAAKAAVDAALALLQADTVAESQTELLRLLVQASAEKTLIDALPAALELPLAERGEFDKLTMDTATEALSEFQASLAEELSEAEAALRDAHAEALGCEAIREVQEEKKETSARNLQAAVDCVEARQADEKAASTALAAHEAERSNFLVHQVLAQDRARKVSTAMAAVERLSNPAPVAHSTAQDVEMEQLSGEAKIAAESTEDIDMPQVSKDLKTAAGAPKAKRPFWQKLWGMWSIHVVFVMASAVAQQVGVSPANLSSKAETGSVQTDAVVAAAMSAGERAEMLRRTIEDLAPARRGATERILAAERALRCLERDLRARCQELLGVEELSVPDGIEQEVLARLPLDEKSQQQSLIGLRQAQLSSNQALAEFVQLPQKLKVVFDLTKRLSSEVEAQSGYALQKAG
ncbi:unnamed protein product [Symbiodinium microadriaticum]|nr:unnamed protein product [Symbiodinium microadriaticum]